MKLRKFARHGFVMYQFACPGCGYEHAFTTVNPKSSNGGPEWSFDGNMESPTFWPSLLNVIQPTVESGRPRKVCHLFLRNGLIEFCPDSTHQLAGQTVPMINVKERDEGDE